MERRPGLERHDMAEDKEAILETHAEAFAQPRNNTAAQ